MGFALDATGGSTAGHRTSAPSDLVREWIRRDVAVMLADIGAALTAEFNLPWPEGQSINVHEQVLAAWRSAAAKSGRIAA